MAQNRDRITLCKSPQEAVHNCDLVVTDTWASMGQEEEQQAREQAFEGYQVNAELMSYARSDERFMDCFPAYRGKVVCADVMEAHNANTRVEEAHRMDAKK